MTEGCNFPLIVRDWFLKKDFIGKQNHQMFLVDTWNAVFTTLPKTFRQKPTNFHWMTNKEKKQFSQQTILQIFLLKTTRFLKNVIYFERNKVSSRDTFGNFKCSFESAAGNFSTIFDNSPLNIRKRLKKTLYSQELFSSVLTFGNSESSFDNLREKTARNPTVLAQSNGWKTERSFWKKIFLLEMFLSSSRLQFCQSCQKHVDKKQIIFC